MKRKVKIINAAAIVSYLFISVQAFAGSGTQDIEFPGVSSRYTDKSKSYMLALKDDSSTNKAIANTGVQSTKFEPALFSGSNVHKYLGLGTLALVVATAAAPKPGEGTSSAQIEEQNSSLHAKLGTAAAFMAAATVTSGLLTHWDDFHLEDGLTDPDNLHVLLGTVGAMAMLYAVSAAPDTQHAGMGVAGGVAMGLAIKLTW